jgi:hypothetical protein
MSTKKPIARKHKRFVKKFVWIFSISLLSFLVIEGGLYFYTMKSPHPLYINPLGRKESQTSEIRDDKNLAVLKKLLSENKIEFSKVTTAKDRFTVYLKNNSVILFSPQKDIQSQFSPLQFILSRLTMEGKQFSQLDLRFDKPVITIIK